MITLEDEIFQMKSFRFPQSLSENENLFRLEKIFALWMVFIFKSDILELFSGGNPSVEKSKNLKKKIFKIFLGRKFSSSLRKKFQNVRFEIGEKSSPEIWRRFSKFFVCQGFFCFLSFNLARLELSGDKQEQKSISS